MGNPVTKREADILDEYAAIMEELNNTDDDDFSAYAGKRDDEDGDW
jgi:hypothetical protein